jgi:hypothetical protein
MSILSGQTVNLLRREVRMNGRRCTEMRRQPKTLSVGLMSPFLEQRDKIDKEILFKPVPFFARNDRRARICRHIWQQILEASRQAGQQATELLMSTILEAALRTFDGYSFSKNKSWDLKKSMKKFQSEYLPVGWSNACDKLKVVRERLRHRNAHPDWLYKGGGSLERQHVTASLDDLIFLSRFYGYMILALAGINDLEPRFPGPHQDWNPLMTVAIGPPNE